MIEVTAHTLAARETVREQVEAIRERLAEGCCIGAIKRELDLCLERLYYCYIESYENGTEYQRVELEARLAADLAGMIQQKLKVST